MENDNTKVGRKAKNGLYNAAFAVRLRELFEENNITQAAVAEKLGTTRQTIGNWLLGKSQPDFETLVKLSDLFETTTDYLLGRTETKTVETNIRSVCDYTGLSEEAAELLNLFTCDFGKSSDTGFLIGFLNYLIVTNGEHDGVVLTFSDCILNYVNELEKGATLNNEYLALKEPNKKRMIYNRIIEQSKNIRYSRFDLEEITADYITDYLKDSIQLYQKTLDQVDKTLKDGEPDGND